ncbi:hypothetical protein Drose_04120 [Dactylosporangium roseum]|uniref:IPT/TIG domain-containing protein n=1 Tax=Dactylosporangium roseum TaxID=47989 RepID=A0ABY5Z5Z6_9ACTN|nr:hypothetical protein [Dactylosporangium roseum]UWZ37475.1 hypothetical protein Drose_04120 [Dactylosporangium roseum]
MPVPPITVEAALGANPTLGAGAWAWTPVTEWVRARNRITITRGRLDSYSSAPPSTCTFEVDNNGGRWVASNPLGPWYGLIRRNTPLRVLVGSNVTVASDSFTRTVVDGWGAADTGGSWNLAGAGGVVSAADFDVTGSAATVSVPVAAAFRFGYLGGLSEVDQEVRVDFICPTPTGGTLEPGNVMLRGQNLSEYYNCRVHVTTASAVQVQIDHASVATLVPATTVPGLTHSPASTIRVRAQVRGTTVRMRVWTGAVEPSVWHAQVVDPAPIANPGWAGIRTGRAAGNTNSGVTATYDNVTVTVPPARFEGFIDELPVAWDPSGTDSTVRLVASGVLRRLQQGTAPLRSAVYRTLTSHDWTAPVAYWPMEDASGSSSLASAVGGPPASFTDLSLAASSSIAGSLPLPTLGPAAVVVADLPPISPSAWSVRHVLAFPAFPAVPVFPLGWFAGGTVTLWGVILTTTGLTLQARDAAFVEVLAAPTIAFPTLVGAAIGVEVSASQSGADIAWSMRVTWSGVQATISGTAAGQTLGAPTRWQIRDSAGLANGTVGHVAWYSTSTNAPPLSGSIDGWAGTTVASRIGGLCHDAGVPVEIRDGSPTTVMGAQARASLLSLLREAEATDLGILSEAGYGLRYLSRWQRYNAPVALALDHEAGQVRDLTPVDDDQRVRNDVTVTRSPGGSSFTWTDPKHIDLYDRYQDSVSVNVNADADLPGQAQWRVHLGTAVGLRYPLVGLALHAHPELVAAWTACQVGSRLTIANPPAGLAPDTIDLIVEGWTEILDDGGGVWLADLACSLSAPWRVAVLAANTGDYSEFVARPDTDGSVLASAISAATTNLWVKTPTGPLWTIEPEECPFDVNIGGERVTATAIHSGDSFDDRLVSSGWGTADSGLAWTCTGGSASDFSVTGV